MKEIVAAILLSASSLTGVQTKSDPSTPMLDSMTHNISEWKPGMAAHAVVVGYCAYLPKSGGNGDILFGAYTTAPENVDGFVNIGNKWCGLRTTGETMECPPPVVGCGG